MMTLKYHNSYKNPMKSSDEVEIFEGVHRNKKYKIKKKFSKYKNAIFDTPPCNVVNGFHGYEDVPRVISAPFVPVVPTIVPVTTMTACLPCREPPIGYPMAVHDWNVMSAGPSPVFSVPYPVPMALYPAPILAPPVCAYTAAMIPPMMPPVVSHPPPSYLEDLTIAANYECEHIHQYSPEQIVPGIDIFSNSPTSTVNLSTDIYDTSSEESTPLKDPIECFLTLPKDVFPRATMLALDPNPIIDQLCKCVDLHSNLSWLLDLEFGVPRGPINRPIPIYDVKYKSINCKNAPDVIHPGFEACSQEFKEVLLFYYDYSISAWYKGFMTTSYDMSVERFQDCLLLLMQSLGMCWA